MTRRLSLSVVLLALAFTGSLGRARPAWAEDAPPPAAPAPSPASPLGRLTEAEQRAVRAKIPDFDALPAEKQEQVVRNVEWLRSADPAHRELVKRRLQQAEQARLGGERLKQRVNGWSALDGRQPLALHQGLVLGGLGRVAWRDLPAEIRDDPQARAVERPFSVAFHRKFWWRAFNALDEKDALAFAGAPDLPQELRDRLASLRAQAGTNPKALGRLKEAVLQARAFEAARDLLPPPGAPRDPAQADRVLRTLGERLRDLARKPYDETLAFFANEWKKNPRAWTEAVLKASQPQEPTPEMRRKIEALQIAFTLEAFAGAIARNPQFVGPSDALLKAALVDELGMSAEDFAALPPRGEGPAQEARSQALRRWVERSNLPREVVRQALQQALAKRWPGAAGMGPGRGGKPGAPPRPPDPVKRPGDRRPEREPEDK